MTRTTTLLSILGTISVATFLTSSALATKPESNIVQNAEVESQLVPEADWIQGGTPAWVALRLQMNPGWHTYWKNPGDSGLPVQITWDLPKGFTASEIHWPCPKRFVTSGLVSYGYDEEVFLLTKMTVPKTLSDSSVTLRAKVKYLACKEECIPGKSELMLRLPVQNQPPVPNTHWAVNFQQTRQLIPNSWNQDDYLVTADDHLFSIRLRGELARRFADGELEFFPKDDLVIANLESPRVRRIGDEVEIQLEKHADCDQDLTQLAGVLGGPHDGKSVPIEFNSPIQPGSITPLEPPSSNQMKSQTSLLQLLLFAFLGGLFLNLMPCVFPVLSIKILGFVQKSGENPHKTRQHGFAYGAGVIASFLVLGGILLAIRATGQQLGWGFQLQSSGFLLVMMGLFFLMALHFLGVFETGSSWMDVGSALRSDHPTWDSFLTGVLAVVVATPCTAPFMGTAVGVALIHPSIATVLIFMMLGVGMAFPYVLLASFPRWIQKLPRPGAWMVTLKEVMAFPLLLTVVWLIWVLGQQVGLDGVWVGLVICILLYLGLWLGQKTRWPRGAFLLTLVIAGFLATTLKPSLPEARTIPSGNSNSGWQWQRFSPERMTQLRAEKKTIFVNFTAAWCITCKVNERIAFTDEVLQRIQDRGIVLVEGDWTNYDAAISEELERHGRAGVPLYLVYHPGKPVKVLPQVLTAGLLLEEFGKNEP